MWNGIGPSLVGKVALLGTDTGVLKEDLLGEYERLLVESGLELYMFSVLKLSVEFIFLK